MNPIIPSGAFFPKTADGHIVNPCAPHLVDQRYQPILQEIIKAYIDQEGANLHSIYLRGSVPRGMTIGDCDLDTFALVFTETDRWRMPFWATDLQKNLKSKYSFLAEAEIYLASYAPVLRSLPGRGGTTNRTTNPNLAMMIKTQSICLHGKDISPQIPMYKPDVNMMLVHRWLKDDLEDFAKAKKDKVVRQQLLKTIIRSGFEVVMPQIQQYTPDLYLCYRSFSDCYPKKEALMNRALVAFLNPEKIKQKEMQQIVDELGWWLVEVF